MTIAAGVEKPTRRTQKITRENLETNYYLTQLIDSQPIVGLSFTGYN